MSKLIKRDWRNWKPQQTPSGKSSSPGSDTYQDMMKFQSLGKGGAEKPKAVKKKAIKLKNNKIKAKIPPIKKTPARIKFNGNKSIYNNNNFNLKAEKLEDFDKRAIIDNFRQHNDWSDEMIFRDNRQYQINKKRAPNIISKANSTRDRRLSGALAIMISKLAEDKSGEPIIGVDEWDIEELMMRSITKRNIYSCMQSRERENIVLVLDSSPSCSRTAILYGNIAYLASKLGNLDIYLAPNARITHKMNIKTRKYEKVFELPRDKAIIHCEMDELHNFFNNRVILFFGDYDGVEQICESSVKNEVYWLNNDYTDKYTHDEYIGNKSFNGTMYEVHNRKDLINVIRKLR